MTAEKNASSNPGGAVAETAVGAAPKAQGRMLRWLSKRWATLGLDSRRDSSSGAIDRTASTRAPVRTLNRDGEAVKLWFRTDRVFYQSGAWYISTREGIDVGPYEDAITARRDAARLIELLLQTSPLGEQGQMLTIHQFMNRPRIGRRR